jgi:hypothetical protein
MASEKDTSNQELIKLKSAYEEMKGRYERANSNFEELLKHGDTALVESTLDLRITNTYGAIDVVFAETKDKFKHGENLMILVYKTTHNVKSIDEEGTLDKEEREDVEKTVYNYISSPKIEKEIRIAGQNNEGEYFLLVWKLVKESKKLKSYFTMIPSNNLVETVKEKLNKRIKSAQESIARIMDVMNDGVTILTMKGVVEYMNKNAQAHFLGQNSLIRTQSAMEGKYFSKLFPNEDPEEHNKYQFFLNRALVTKKPQAFNKTIQERSVEINITPLFDDENNVHSIALISNISNTNVATSSSNISQEKLINTIKALVDDKKIQSERLKELKSNQEWLMKKHREDTQSIKQFHSTVKNLYHYLDSIPLPMSIHSLAEHRFEFINKAFEQKVKINKADILGKTPENVFIKEIAELLIAKSQENIDNQNTYMIEDNNFRAIQRVFTADDVKITYLIRIYLELKV